MAMTRQVVLDTETTGLNAKLGDRIIEIGCVEILSRRVSRAPLPRLPESRARGRPRRDAGARPDARGSCRRSRSSPRSRRTSSTSSAAPSSSSTTPTSTSSSSTWSSARCGWARSQDHAARGHRHAASPRGAASRTSKNSLDALCERYFIDNSNRTLHGALLDARLLAECYLAMTRGQESLMMELEAPAAAAAAAAGLILDVSKLIVQQATPEELLSTSSTSMRWKRRPRRPAYGVVYSIQHECVRAGPRQESGELRAADPALVHRARGVRLSATASPSSTARSATPGRKPTRAAAASPRRCAKRGIGVGDTVAVDAAQHAGDGRAHFGVPMTGGGAQHAQHAARCRGDRLHARARRSEGADHRPRVLGRSSRRRCEARKASRS